MIKKLMMMLLVVTFLAGSIYAANNVYVTKNGTKYHKAECILIKNKNAEAVDKDEAIKKGLLPCKRCFKEDIVAGEAK